MKNFSNIEKLEGRKYYTGYAGGDVWRIHREPSGMWKCAAKYSGKSFKTWTLDSASEKLAAISANFKN